MRYMAAAFSLTMMTCRACGKRFYTRSVAEEQDGGDPGVITPVKPVGREALDDYRGTAPKPEPSSRPAAVFAKTPVVEHEAGSDESDIGTGGVNLAGVDAAGMDATGSLEIPPAEAPTPIEAQAQTMAAAASGRPVPLPLRTEPLLPAIPVAMPELPAAAIQPSIARMGSPFDPEPDPVVPPTPAPPTPEKRKSRGFRVRLRIRLGRSSSGFRAAS